MSIEQDIRITKRLTAKVVVSKGSPTRNAKRRKASGVSEDLFFIQLLKAAGVYERGFTVWGAVTFSEKEIEFRTEGKFHRVKGAKLQKLWDQFNDGRPMTVDGSISGRPLFFRDLRPGEEDTVSMRGEWTASRQRQARRVVARAPYDAEVKQLRSLAKEINDQVHGRWGWAESKESEVQALVPLMDKGISAIKEAARFLSQANNRYDKWFQVAAQPKFSKGDWVYIVDTNAIGTVIDIYGGASKDEWPEYRTDTDGMRDGSVLEPLEAKHFRIKGVHLPPSVYDKLPRSLQQVADQAGLGRAAKTMTSKVSFVKTENGYRGWLERDAEAITRELEKMLRRWGGGAKTDIKWVGNTPDGEDVYIPRMLDRSGSAFHSAMNGYGSPDAMDRAIQDVDRALRKFGAFAESENSEVIMVYPD